MHHADDKKQKTDKRSERVFQEVGVWDTGVEFSTDSEKIKHTALQFGVMLKPVRFVFTVVHVFHVLLFESIKVKVSIIPLLLN